MDDTAQETGENDAFARLLAQLNAPTTDPVVTDLEPSAGPIVAPTPQTRAPELRGADELAAPPRPFPPLPAAATPLVVPPAPPTSAAPAVSSAPAPATPIASTPPRAAPVSAAVPVESAPSPSDFSLLLAAPPPASEGPGPSSPLDTAPYRSDEPDIGRSTVGEKTTLLLAILVPPLGLLAAVVGAILSARRRGWVIGLLRAAIAIGLVLSVAAGIGGYLGLTALQQQQAHDRTAAASAAFCSTITAQPTLISSPAFGWPAAGATITDSLAAMQTYADTWTKLAKASPDGIRPEVAKVATAAKQIINSVTVARTVDDASNIALMTATASASGVPGWYAEYCT